VAGRTKVVVISLPDAADRRATFTERARGTTIPWTWFDAHRELAPGLTHDPDETIVAKGRPMYPGELGCYSSHYAAWRMFLDSGAPQMLVLEDDTIVDWGFLEKLVAVDLQAAGIPYLRLYAKRPCAFREVLRDAVEQQRTLIEYLDRPLGTQGYVMTREGAQRFVRHCRVVRRPLDDELDRSWEHGVACLGIFPFPVIEQSTASTIGPARFERFTIPSRLRVRRQAMKMRDRVLKLRQRFRLLTGGRPAALRSLAAR
jgi:glycosyl transferase family 25